MKPDSSVLGRPVQLTEAQWNSQKLYLYQNLLLSGPNRSHKRIQWTNWVCGIVLLMAIGAAIYAAKTGF